MLLESVGIVIHDAKCEQNHRACQQCAALTLVYTPHCHCGSRAFPLCKGCRDAKHLAHVETEPSTGQRCCCDLCATEETAA